MPRILGLPSARSAASFATGAMLALVGSRLLPPFIAHARGMARGSGGGDPFASLLEDHGAIMSHLNAMVESADNEAFVRTQRLVRLKRRLGAHALAEENVLYPALRAGAETTDDALHLFGEHAEMKILLYKLEQTPSSEEQWHSYAMELRTLIENHIRQEEDVDFPKLRESLDTAGSTELCAKIEREKAMLL
jgi:iron-sulfur cluster repair protein YtfE (RIC family)